MKHSSSVVVLSALLSSASAYIYESGQGFGNSSADGSPGESAFITANHNPNATKSVPFRLDGQDFTFRVNVSAVDVEGADTSLDNPRVINSAYDISWPDSSSNLNTTMRDAQNLSPDQDPRMCVSMFYGVFSASTTNAYEEDDDGDCSGALGDDCANALMNHGYALGVPCADGGSIPDECRDAFNIGGAGSTSLTKTSVQSSPMAFGFWSSPIYQEGDETYYERETERLHVLVFSGKTSAPVCVRVKTDDVQKSSPATGSAAGLWTNWLWYGVAAAMAGVAFLV